ncbi:MAG: hypothetical protein Unbinned4388contig1000_67 [Prokaryotic dsDNA virus sp.]|nr:MAG: hypothetical protein Unbinned4388contig1000_67 [Prokaryotic dsDNA virus sp.]|tara:strand:- start:1232 stop:1522 length:291 start_codon:yes stop_codon:yes gene_type:complete
MIHLKDHKEAVYNAAMKRNSNTYFEPRIITEGLDICVDENLRYNPKKGFTYRNDRGKCGEYCNSDEIPKYDSKEEAAIWEFTNWVRNEASKITNGY